MARHNNGKSKTSPATAGAQLNRRTLLRGSATAALLAAAKTLVPGGANVAWAAGPETNKAALGYIALTDSAPLIIAKEKGLYAKYGMPNVDVLKQASWGATRDNLVLGSASNGIDGAHILSPLPYLMTAGKVTQNNIPVPMSVLARLNFDCQGISVAKEYADLKLGTDSSALKEAFAKKRAAGKEVKVAVTFPGGTHDLWMRYWLAAGGIDPDKDVATIVVPPPQMVANMKVGTMDAFCVGEPWNEQLVHQDIGFTACTTGELWFRHPEKALGMRTDWVETNPKSAEALLMAVMEAQQWCDKPENKVEMAEILGRRQWFNVPPDDVIGRLKGDINYGRGRIERGTKLFMKFWEDGTVSYPFKSHDAWFVTEGMRWGKFDPATDVRSLVDKVNREDIWREAAKSLGVSAPGSTSRGLETFFDGKVFDPDNPTAYLASLAIKRMAA